MYVLGHDHVSGDVTSIPAADTLKFQFENTARGCAIEQLQALVAAEGYEVQAALVLVTDRFNVHSAGL
jgi:hypothetical protein